MAKLNWKNYKYLKCKQLGHISNLYHCQTCELYRCKNLTHLTCIYYGGLVYYLPMEEMKHYMNDLRYAKYQRFTLVKKRRT